MTLFVKQDVAVNPINVDVFGSPTVVLRTDDLPNAIEKLRRATGRTCVRSGLATPTLNNAGWLHSSDPLDDDGIVGREKSMPGRHFAGPPPSHRWRPPDSNGPSRSRRPVTSSRASCSCAAAPGPYQQLGTLCTLAP
jgi:hypothetical protein